MDPHRPLLARISEGDKTALAALYQALERPVFRFIQSRLNDPFESADLLHDVFLEVWRSAGRFEGRSKVQTWIFGIAYRKVIDLHRKRGRQDLTDEIAESVDEDVDTELCVAATEEAAHLSHCLEALKPDHRDAITLAFYKDMTYGEIAEVVSAPEGTIKTRIHHAKKLLLTCLQGRMRLTGASRTEG